MSKNTRIVIGLLALGVVILGGFYYLARARAQAQTVAAVGTVVSAKREGRSGKHKTIVTLSYRAGAVEAVGRHRVGGSHEDEYPAGRQLPICYNPADTTSLRIANGPCG